MTRTNMIDESADTTFCLPELMLALDMLHVHCTIGFKNFSRLIIERSFPISYSNLILSVLLIL